MADTGLKTMMAFFTPEPYADGTEKVSLDHGEFAGLVRKMDAKAMIKEWKSMSDEDKAAIRDGIEDGSFTYA
jgi:hypothetical protein